jgi:hypothetical protein
MLSSEFSTAANENLIFEVIILVIIPVNNGKRKLTLDLAKKLHSKFQIDANLILETS